MVAFPFNTNLGSGFRDVTKATIFEGGVNAFALPTYGVATGKLAVDIRWLVLGEDAKQLEQAAGIPECASEVSYDGLVPPGQKKRLGKKMKKADWTFACCNVLHSKMQLQG